jgi:hypothetical protein
LRPNTWSASVPDAEKRVAPAIAAVAPMTLEKSQVILLVLEHDEELGDEARGK